uniref:Hydrophobin n=1 Tax=Bionectria ochroleuca TaxID=29856 RepID=A0A8H7TTI0_BIOOC
MKFIATTILVAATTAVARYDPCRSPLFAVPLCCKTDVLGLLGLNCEAPSVAPLNAGGFQTICETANARDAKCCLAHLLDQAVVCIPPVPKHGFGIRTKCGDDG